MPKIVKRALLYRLGKDRSVNSVKNYGGPMLIYDRKAENQEFMDRL
jgi:hypothetical protein